MDFTTLPFSCMLLVMCTILFIYTKKIIFGKSSKLPPGPNPLPIVGNLFEIGDQPHQSLAKLSITYGPLMTLKLGTKTTVVASSSDVAKQIQQKYDHAFSDRWVPHAGKTLDHHKHSVAWLPVEPRWRLLRKVLVMKLFTMQQLDASQAVRQEKVKQLVDFAHDTCKSGGNKSLDVGQAAFTTALNFLSNTFFSLDLAKHQSNMSHEFRNLISAAFELAGKPNLVDFFPVLKLIGPRDTDRQMTIVTKRILEIFEQIIDQRLKLRAQSQEPSAYNDVLDALLNLGMEKDYDLSANDIKHLLMDAFIAGTDTTSSTVEWAMAELMHNPSKMVKVQAEFQQIIGNNKHNIIQESDIPRLPYLQAVVKETFRRHPAAPLLLPRKANTNVEINGFTVPKDAEILVNAWAIGRDPKTWSNPNLFEPERFLGSDIDFKGGDFNLIPFGAGRRICPGLPLAHRMVHLMLASLLHSFEWKLENGMKPEDIDMSDRFGLTLQKAEPLMAIPTVKG